MCEGSLAPLMVEEILEKHGPVFSSPNATEEDIIEDLDLYPLMNTAGNLMAVYDQNGHLISRYNVVPAPGAQLAGVFLLLDKVKGLFEEQFMETNKGRYCHSNQIDKYPVGHLPGVGCIQT